MTWIQAPRLVGCLVLGVGAARTSPQDSRPALSEPPEGAKRHLLKDATTFTVDWRTPVEWGADAEIEVDSGRYDCCFEREPALAWYRIRRVGDRVEVLHFVTGGGNDPAGAGRVRIARAQMDPAAQGELLRDLAWISAARLHRPETGLGMWFMMGCDLWSYARLSDGSGACWEDAWAGGTGSIDEIRYAKSRAFVDRVKEAVSRAGVEPFEPSPGERRRILDALPLRAYASRPWTAFGGTEPLTDLYRRLVLELGGEPASCLPQPREEVEFRIGPARPISNVPEKVTIRAVSNEEVATYWWICRQHPMSFDCWTVRLEPGEYVAVLDAPEYEPRRFPLTVRPGERATVDLELVKRDQPR